MNVFKTWISTPVPIFKVPEMARLIVLDDICVDDLFQKRLISINPGSPIVSVNLSEERTYGKLLYNEDDIKAELTKNATSS